MHALQLELDDAGATPGDQLDEAFARQLAEGLAHGAVGDAEALGDLALANPVAGLEAPVDDVLHQLVGDVPVERGLRRGLLALGGGGLAGPGALGGAIIHSGHSSLSYVAGRSVRLDGDPGVG